MSQHRFFATSPKGMEGLLEGEIRRLGGRSPRVHQVWEIRRER